MPNNNDVADALGIEPEDEPVLEPVVDTQAVVVTTSEVDEVKDNVDAVIQCVGVALNQLSDVCAQVATSEHFSALATLTNSYLNANKLKLDIIRNQTKDNNAKPGMAGGATPYGGSGENTTIFMGSPADILRIAQQVKDDNPKT